MGNNNETIGLNETGGLNGTTAFELKVTEGLWAYVGMTILLIGTVGHCISIIVLGKSRSMRTQSSTVYLVAMSLAGLFSLYTGLLRYTILIGITKWEYDFRHAHNAVCKIHMMLTYASLQYFAWVQATVAVDRLISVRFPHRYMTSCKSKVGLIVVSVELGLCLCLNLPVVFSVGVKDNECRVVFDKFFRNVWANIDLVSYSLLPAAVMTVCNSLILVMLSKNKMKARNQKDITIMLMSLNLFFLMTTLPISVIFFIDWGIFPQKRFIIVEMWWTIFSLIQYTGAAGTFFVYCITGSKFRDELRRVFRLQPAGAAKRSRANNNNNNTASSPPVNCQYSALKVSMPDDATSLVSL